MSGEKHTLAYDDVTIHDSNEKTVYSRDETALSSGVGHDHNEKSVHLRDQTALSSGVKQDVPYDDVEHARKGSRRKSSVIAAIKDNYGLVDAPSSEASSLKAGVDYTHRKLKPRHIQLIGIGGTIGTALYVNIGRGLLNGGPASLFIAFSLW